LIQVRFQALERGPPAGSFDVGEQGCQSPAHGSSQRNERAQGKDAAGEIRAPKVAESKTVLIDLTNNPEDDEPERSLPTAESPESPGNKRKRNDSASKSNAQSDQHQLVRVPEDSNLLN
jgi:hypothetical protein